MTAIRLGAVLLLCTGTAAAAQPFSSQYPHWYGFSAPPLYSHNPWVFWNYSSDRALIDQRTAKRFHDRTGLRLRPSGVVYVYDMDGPPTPAVLPEFLMPVE